MTPSGQSAADLAVVHNSERQRVGHRRPSGESATTVSWTQITSGANASGTLTVAEGGSVANITLLGQYATADFSVQSDGIGGTLDHRFHESCH